MQTALFDEKGTLQVTLGGALVRWNGAPRAGTFALSFTGAAD